MFPSRSIGILVVRFLDQLAIGIVTRGRPGGQELPLGGVLDLDGGERRGGPVVYLGVDTWLCGERDTGLEFPLDRKVCVA